MSSSVTRTAGVAGTFTYTMSVAPFAAPVLTIYSDALRTVVAVAAAPTTATGNPAAFTCAYPASLPAGTYYVSFSTVVTNGQPALVDQTETLVLATAQGSVNPSYAAIADIRAYGIVIATADDPTVADKLEIASRIIDDYTGTLFTQVTKQVVVDDVRRPMVILPAPFTAITQVLIQNGPGDPAGAVVDPSQYTVETWGIRLYSSSYLESFPRSVGIYARTVYGATLSVTATFGWAAIPSKVRQACILIAARLIGGRGETLLDPRIQALTVEGYSVRYGGSGTNLIDTTGVDEADRLLQAYRQSPRVVA